MSRIVLSTDVAAALRRRRSVARAQRGFIIDPFKFGNDPNFGNVKYLLHLNDPTNPYAFVDVVGNSWARESTGAPSDFQIKGTNPKFGDGSLYVKTATGTSTDYGIAATPAGGSYSLGSGNVFTLEGWMYWSGNIDSRISVGGVLAGATMIATIEFHTTNTIRFRTELSAQDDRTVTPPLNQWVHMALCYDGTTKYWAVNGTVTSATVAAGSTRTITGYRCRGSASGGASADAYIDELRFTAGVCRYTANFTPPSAAFPNG